MVQLLLKLKNAFSATDFQLLLFRILYYLLSSLKKWFIFFSSTDNPQQDLLDTFPEKTARNGHFYGALDDQNGLHLNPTDFRMAADVPDINPMDVEEGDPIMSAGM